jgi:hypothetical protein
MMELRFVVQIGLPDRSGRKAMARAARDLLHRLAVELIRCSADQDPDAAPMRATTRRRRRRFSAKSQRRVG